MEQLAKVYARALFEAAESAGTVGVIRDQLGALTDAVAGSRDLQTFFFSPYFSSAEKRDGLSKAVSGIDKQLQNFVELLIDGNRMPALMRIRSVFEQMADKADGLLPVALTSATPLDPSAAETLGKKIGEQTGRKVSLSTSVDPEIIGGLVLRVGNQILDASIRTRLERLRHQVATGA